MKPSKQPPSDEVAAFLSHYRFGERGGFSPHDGVAERLGRPRERIVTWLARLQSAFNGTDAVTLADALHAGDVRLTVFYLEGLLKLYVARYPELGSVFERVKALEDAMGAMGAARGLTELVKTLAVPPDTVAWCEQQQVTMRDRVAELLAKDWLPNYEGKVPLFAELLSTLGSLEFEGYRRDRKTVISEIRRRLGKLEDTSLDMFELQGNRGLHELRRQLRWIPIYCVALDGLVVTDPASHPIKAYAELLDSEIAKSPYARLPEPTREDKPVSISFSLFLANTHFISELGRLKDSGEMVEGVEHALLGSGVTRASIDAHNEALRLLRRSPEEQHAVHLLAENLYKELRKKRFFKRLRADFKR
jgi:hypothetical protein